MSNQIPKYIKDSIIKCQKYSKLANKENLKIREWFDKNGLGEEDNSYVTDQFIDCVEFGDGDANEFILWLESELK